VRAVLQLRTLGGLSIEANGAPLMGAAVQRKTLALLSLLAAPGLLRAAARSPRAWAVPRHDGAALQIL